MNPLALTSLASASYSSRSYAERMMIGTSAPTKRLICRVVSMPFIWGIFKSMITAKYSFSAKWCCRTFSIASLPEYTHSLFIPISCKQLDVFRQAILSSSTTRTSKPSTSILSSGFWSRQTNGMSMVKREPLPYSLSTLISPPIIWMILWLIDIPRPVPCILLISSSLARSKGSKILSRNSGFIPLPLSSNTNW